MSTVATNRIPPDPMTYFWVAAPAVDPPTSVKMMAMGMTVNGRKKVVRRLSSRSGYSISSVAGYCAATLRIVAPPVGVDASRRDSGRLEPAAILEDNDALGDQGRPGVTRAAWPARTPQRRQAHFVWKTPTAGVSVTSGARKSGATSLYRVFGSV